MERTKILDLVVPGYTEKFLTGQFGLDEMPLLEAMGAKLTSAVKPSDLKNVHLVACQHMLAPQLEMFRLFIRLGIPSSQITILPKIYSANNEIISELQKLGCTVIEEALTFKPKVAFDFFHENQCASLVDLFISKKTPPSKLIILDDGGMLIKEFAKRAKQLAATIAAVEQTASGKNILLHQELPFVVTSVASSIEKIQIETHYIIRHSMMRITEYFIEQNIPHTAKILVLGKGPIGQTLIDRLLEQNYDCTGYDVSERKPKPGLSTFDVILGATGKNSVSIKDLSLLKKGTHLISVSSSDREFPSVHIRNNSLSGKNVHDTFTYSKNFVHLANGGFPITFKGKRVEFYPLEMDVTKMKLFEAVIEHTIGKTGLNTSVNELYCRKRLQKFRPLIHSWIFILTTVSTLKLVLFGFELPPLWLELLFVPIFIYGCIPIVWAMRYQKRLELFIKKCSL